VEDLSSRDRLGAAESDHVLGFLLVAGAGRRLASSSNGEWGSRGGPREIQVLSFYQLQPHGPVVGRLASWGARKLSAAGFRQCCNSRSGIRRIGFQRTAGSSDERALAAPRSPGVSPAGEGSAGEIIGDLRRRRAAHEDVVEPSSLSRAVEAGACSGHRATAEIICSVKI
jgi:hypothetical protein